VAVSNGYRSLPLTRLQQHRAPDPAGRTRREGEVVHGEFVLFAGWYAVLAISVQGVERRTPKAFADAGDESLDVSVTRDRLLERPPELDRVEAGGLGGGWPLQQWELGEEDGAVDVVPDCMRHRASPRSVGILCVRGHC
jgi:hypothetical protein